MTHTANNDLTRRVIDCVMEVHGQAGPGLSKDVYEACLTLELAAAGLRYESGRVLPVVYDGHDLGSRLQTDLIVAETVLVQVEAADAIELIHEQKLRTCLAMGGYPMGLLVNFNVAEIDDGIFVMDAYAMREPPAMRDVFDDPDLGSTF
jgi:GxxExxY protein